MEKTYIGVNFPNLISIAIMVGVVYACFQAARKLGLKVPIVDAQ